MTIKYRDSQLLSLYRYYFLYMCEELDQNAMIITVKEVVDEIHTHQFVDRLYKRYFKYIKAGRIAVNRRHFVTFLTRYFNEVGMLCQDERFLQHAGIKSREDGLTLLKTLSVFPETYGQYLKDQHLSYRNQTYVTYAGCYHDVQPDLATRFVHRLKQWDEEEQLQLSFHESTQLTTYDACQRKRHIQRRLEKCKSMMIVVYEDMREDKWLDYEIELAICEFKIPLIVVYFGRKRFGTCVELTHELPDLLRKQLSRRSPKVGVMHVAYVKEAVVQTVKEMGNAQLELISDFKQYSHRDYVRWQRNDQLAFYEPIKQLPHPLVKPLGIETKGKNKKSANLQKINAS